MPLPIADRWFEMRRLADDVTLLWEPHVVAIMRCNIWHVRGRERDLLIDTGMGIARLRQAARELLDKPVIAVATHTHADHIGSHWEFEESLVHRNEADGLRRPSEATSLMPDGVAIDGSDPLVIAGYELAGGLVTALPRAGYDPSSYRIPPARVTRVVEDGDVVDTGDRRFRVLHLPGHSPGSIALWERRTGILFSGDALYEGELFDELPHSSIPEYRRSMARLRELPVRVVHAGHNASFGRERLIELTDAYLRLRQAA